MSTTTQVMTADNLASLPKRNLRRELVRGEVREMSPAGFEHGVIVAKLTLRLARHIEATALGVVCGAETGFKIASEPDTVRAPDVAFVRHERLAQIGVTKKFFPGAPDLAVEVVSPGDRVEEVDEKVVDWLAAGARGVWIVNPKLRTVTCYRSLTEVTMLTENDELDGEEIVPGFRCPVAEIFV